MEMKKYCINQFLKKKKNGTIVIWCLKYCFHLNKFYCALIFQYSLSYFKKIITLYYYLLILIKNENKM